jgi:hypothetical protein
MSETRSVSETRAVSEANREHARSPEVTAP